VSGHGAALTQGSFEVIETCIGQVAGPKDEDQRQTLAEVGGERDVL
jgi:hypothetical protein